MGACASSQHTSEPVIYRHAVITGASSGIGAALALALARQARCQNLTLLGRDMARLSAVAEACAVAMGTNDAVHTCTIDVMDRTGLAAALAAAHARVPLGLVVCNAGVAVTPAPPPGMSEKHIHTCTCTRDDIDSLNLSLLACADVNITGTLNTLTAALPLLHSSAASGEPTAVALMSSISALPSRGVAFAGQLQRGLSAYTWSKQALLSLGEGLCGELTGSGISVHVICPGVVITEMAIGLATALGGQRHKPSSGAVSDAVMAEAMLRQRLAALSADEAAEYILQGLVTNKGGVISFPPRAVRSLALSELLPQRLLLRLVQRSLASQASTL